MLRYALLPLIAVFCLALAVPARAEMTIGVLDMQKILGESDAAVSILGQVKTRREALEKEIKTLEAELKKDEGDLIKKKATLKPEEFDKARLAFEKKVRDTRTKVQQDRGALDRDFNAAIGTLRNNLLEVTAKLAGEKKIQLVITKQNVVIGDNSLEITKEVMTRLNGQIKTIKLGK